jgi:hypothetical protein
MNYALTGKNSQKLRRQDSGDGGQTTEFGLRIWEFGFPNADFGLRIGEKRRSIGRIVKWSNGPNGKLSST